MRTGGILCLLFLVQVLWSGQVHATDYLTLAQKVTIHRDTYNVPHIFGKTNAACGYGMAWAQCEDNFEQLAFNLLGAQARTAEWSGEPALRQDVLVRRHRIHEVVEENYKSLPPPVRSLCDGFAAGVNDFISTHPSELGKTLGKVDGVDVAAFGRLAILFDFVLGQGQYIREVRPDDGRGSNMWAIAPKRTSTGHAMLVVNPHLRWDGRHYWYEAHVRSEEGYEMAGACFLGLPVPAIGHGRHVAWSHTVNGIDLVDLWEERVQGDPPTTYQYGNEQRPVERIELKLRSRKGGVLVGSTHTEYRTHRGPLFQAGGKWYSVRSSVDDEPDFITGRYHVGMAGSIDELREILKRYRQAYFNLMAADTSGNIFYVYNGRPPIRPTGANPRRPLLGWDPKSEWQGTVEFDELPQMLNPRCGYMQNCNSSPYYTAADDNPRELPIHRQFVTHGMNMRAHSALRLLAGLENCSWERFQQSKFDNRCELAARVVPDLVKALNAAPPEWTQENPDAARAGKLLEAWDYRASTDSPAMIVFYEWTRQFARDGNLAYSKPFDGDPLRTPAGLADPERALAALVSAAQSLKRTLGDVDIPWGKVQVIRRAGREFPLGGGPGAVGCLRTIGSSLEGKRLVATGGDSFVMAVHLTDPIQAVSIHPFGNSTNPASRHYTQQTELFSRDQFKPAWFSDADIAAHTTRSYHPGE